MTALEILLAIPGGFLLLAIIFLVVVSLRPADFAITRSTTIAAPPADVFEHVNDLHKWEAWSPWAKLDPTMTKSYAGPAAGPGASYTWKGKGTVGEGTMTVTETTTPTRLGMRLDFRRPMVCTNAVEFRFEPTADGAGTVVTWTMTGRNGLAGKAFDFMLGMDRVVGKDFATGLANLKALAEAGAKV